MTTSTPSTLTGLAAVRARQAELAEQAENIAKLLSPDNKLANNFARLQRMRDGLRHIAGLAVLPPEQPAIDDLLELRLVELHRPDAAPVCGRYRPTGLGVEVLGLLGRASR